jgi:hemolysin-activating ACP:hemolysin acyltransferase
MAAAYGPKVRNSGPHPWLIDLAAPPQVLPQVLAELQKNVFKGETVRTLMKRPEQQGRGTT